MEYFHFELKGGDLWCEGVPVRRVAERVGTPVYVYSRDVIHQHITRLQNAFRDVETLICYSVKALPNLAICQVVKELGVGFDVVSGGEIFRVRQAGGRPGKIVFAGVGKTPEDIDYALDSRILMFNVESESELKVIDLIASQRGVVADVALRVNPDVDPMTHRYITTGKRENKFGIDIETADRIVGDLPGMKGVRMVGVHAHIGSQITDPGPHAEALEKVLEFADRSRKRGNPVEWVNLGGGFGIHYRGDEGLPPQDLADALIPLIKGSGYRLILEPGRFIVGNAGILVTRVLYVKPSGDRRFLVCDAGMNDLLRPSLYEAHHEIWPVTSDFEKGSPEAEAAGMLTDVVGPVCESGDILGLDRMLPPVVEGDLLAVFSAGAYGMAMASNYNGRPRPAEVLVSGDLFDVIRARESWDDLIAGERQVPRWD